MNILRSWSCLGAAVLPPPLPGVGTELWDIGGRYGWADQWGQEATGG